MGRRRHPRARFDTTTGDGGMKVRIERSGGFANMQAIASVDTETLPDEAADEVRALVDEVRRQSSSASLPDAFRYHLTVEDDDGNMTAATVGESDAAARLFNRLVQAE